MSKISYLSSINNAIENNEMLRFASEVLNSKNFIKLYKSYRQLFWFQLSFPIVSVVLTVLGCIIFNSCIDIVLLIAASGFIFGFIIWMILSQFLAGRLWHKYVKWYKKQQIS